MNNMSTKDTAHCLRDTRGNQPTVTPLPQKTGRVTPRGQVHVQFSHLLTL